jgi:hypothetical protein
MPSPNEPKKYSAVSSHQASRLKPNSEARVMPATSSTAPTRSGPGRKARGQPVGQPQQQDRQREELEVDGHVPHAGGEGVLVEQVVEQQHVGEELAEVGRLGDGAVLHPHAGHGRARNGQQQRRRIGHHQAGVALEQQRQRRAEGRWPG